MKRFGILSLILGAMLLSFGAPPKADAQNREVFTYLVQGQTDKLWHTFSVSDSATVAQDWVVVKDSGHLVNAGLTVTYAKYYTDAALYANGELKYGTLIDSFGHEPTFTDLSLAGITATNGKTLIGNTITGRFDVATLTGTSNQVTVTNGAGSITLSTPQSIATTSTPTFASETLTGTSNQLVLGTTRTATITAPTPATSSRVYTVPDPGAAANFSMLVAGNGRQAWVVLSADSATTGQSLIGSPLQFAVGASQTWQFEAWLYLSSSSAAGNEIAVDIPASATIAAGARGNAASATAFSSDLISADATATAAYITVNGSGVVKVEGTVITAGTSGSVIIDFLKVTSGTATLKAGSYIIARRVS